MGIYHSHSPTQLIRLLVRTRYGRGKVRFVAVPAMFDQNSNKEYILNAALVAGLYPKVLTVEPGSGQLRTLSNNQPASFHPSSVNFHRRPKDFSANHLCYFTLMSVDITWRFFLELCSHSYVLYRHSKKLYAWESSPIDDLAMFLLCGDADFKVRFLSFPKRRLLISINRFVLALYQLSSNSAFLDRKIKFNVAPKTNMALKLLRARLLSVLAIQMRGKSLSPGQQRWNELALLVLSKIPVELDDEEEAVAKLPPSVELIF